jgi:CRP/FNR family transcriptional regulator, cyclic AMP receptor protein
MQENKHWYLRNHKLFEQLTAAEIDMLCIISNMKNATKNDLISFSESETKKIFIVKSGTLKVCRGDANGKEIISEILTEGDIFGHINASINNSKNEYAKVISDDVKLCYCEAENFKLMLQSNPILSINYNNVVHEKLVSFQQKYEDLIFKDVDTRVYDFFKRYASYHGKEVGTTIEMDMMLTHQDIADYVAASRQTVTTIINRLVESGKIVYEGRKKVIIPNMHHL